MEAFTDTLQMLCMGFKWPSLPAHLSNAENSDRRYLPKNHALDRRSNTVDMERFLPLGLIHPC